MLPDPQQPCPAERHSETEAPMTEESQDTKLDFIRQIVADDICLLYTSDAADE